MIPDDTGDLTARSAYLKRSVNDHPKCQQKVTYKRSRIHTRLTEKPSFKWRPPCDDQLSMKAWYRIFLQEKAVEITTSIKDFSQATLSSKQPFFQAREAGLCREKFVIMDKWSLKEWVVAYCIVTAKGTTLLDAWQIQDY